MVCKKVPGWRLAHLTAFVFVASTLLLVSSGVSSSGTSESAASAAADDAAFSTEVEGVAHLIRRIKRQLPPVASGASDAASLNSSDAKASENICDLYDRLCDHICLSTAEGSHRCACRDGFILQNDARTCLPGTAPNPAVETPRIEAPSVEIRPETHPAGRISNDRCVSSNPCDQLCRDTGVAIICDCSTGFILSPDQKTCLDLDECEEGTHACHADLRCVNTRGGYECHHRRHTRPIVERTTFFNGVATGTLLQPDTRPRQPTATQFGHGRGCPTGFRRNPATGACDDINECQFMGGRCLQGQRCENTRGSYRCVRENPCGTGYTLDSDTQRCEDDNECDIGTHNCGPAFSCTNTQGSFRCIAKQCTEGFLLNYSTGTCDEVHCAKGYRATYGGTCIDINECEAPNRCKNHERCINTIGSYRCQSLVQCRPGFKISEIGTNCIDVNECVINTHKCFPDQSCINEPGGYRCVCPKGYRINRYSKQCEDLNECLHYGGAVCSPQAVCENTPGSYRCKCNPGFEAVGDGRNCRDINECLISSNLCDHKCINTWGSYECACNNGYEKSLDGQTCQDVNECERFHDNGRGRLCLGICNNTPGSFECSCPDGYHLMNDRRTCQDIDECATGTAGCNGAHQVCINTRGGFKCNTITCPDGYVKTRGSRNRCQRKSLICPRDDQACLTAPLSYSHNFLSFPSKIRIPADLFTMRGPFSPIQRLQFDLKMLSAVDPRTGESRVVRDFFYLKHFRDNEAVVSLLREIEGPQDVELELEMKIFTNGQYSGTAVAKIFLFVTKNEF